MSNISYEIQETLLLFPPDGRMHKELNLISWNGRPAKYDLRFWNQDRSEMGKGVTLTKEELLILKEKLGGLDYDHS